MVLIVAAACGAPGEQLRYRFDSVANPVSSVTDDSGNGRTGSVSSNGAPGASIAAVSPGWGGTGKAVSYPAPCPNANPSCPRVVITTPDAAALNPGTGSFTFGLRVRIWPGELTADHGSNLMQKGTSGTGQWKVQLDDAATGRPSCVLRSRANPSAPVRLTASVGVADGTWHRVACQRAGSELMVLVDGGVAGRKALPDGFDVRAAGRALTIGGRNASAGNDQYHGDLDGVYFHRG